MAKGWTKKKKYIAALLTLCSIVGVYFVAPLIVNSIQKLFDRQSDDRKRITHLWYTLQEVGEIKDPENLGPDPELIIALRAISAVEFDLHRELWDKHVKGTEAEFERLLDKVEVVVKIKHRPTFDLIALRDTGAKILAKADISKSWTAAELPLELSGLAHKLASKTESNENTPFLPYAMIDRWSFQSRGKVSDLRFPAIDLAEPNNRNALAQIATNTGSAELADLAAKQSGLLIPTFGKSRDLQNCIKYDIGLVEVDTQNERCRPIVREYMAAAKASANLSKSLAMTCKSDLIRFSNSTVDIDPCAGSGELTASAFCDRSIEAFIRKMIKSPKSKEDVHRTFLLNNCKEEIGRLSKEHRMFVEGPAQK